MEAPEEQVSTTVEHPAHYASGNGVECIDVMEGIADKTDLSAFDGYLWLSAFKYLFRWRMKNGVEDLRKCRWFLDRLIERLEREEGKRDEG